jgi:hypothetical protein
LHRHGLRGDRFWRLSSKNGEHLLCRERLVQVESFRCRRERYSALATADLTFTQSLKPEEGKRHKKNECLARTSQLTKVTAAFVPRLSKLG